VNTQGAQLEVDGATELGAALEQFAKYFRKPIRAAYRDQFRLLLARNVGPQTPPATVYKGQRVVARDIQRAVQPTRAAQWEDKGVRKMIMKRDYAGLREFAARTAGGRWDFVQFSPELHEERRNSRGAVRTGSGLLTPDVQELRAYIKKKQENVGKARGGWVAAIIRLGGKVQPWLMRHAGQGEFTDALDQDNGYLKQSNRSPWADGKSDTSTINRSVASRARAILEDMRLREERAAKAAGLKK